jgi:hypothetical protein
MKINEAVRDSIDHQNALKSLLEWPLQSKISKDGVFFSLCIIFGNKIS